MASSSGQKRSPCSNTKCRRAIDVSRPGWKFFGRQVNLCNQCYVAYMKKQFCYIYHKNSTSWSFCKFCNKKIHRPCLVSLDWYITLEDGGIKCNVCAPQDIALVPSSQETMHDSTSTPTPLTSVPQTQVENIELIIDEVHEAQQSTSSALAQVQARSEKSRFGLYRYTPRMTAEELKDIFKGSNVEVTPLFEKILSASDTGKSGRLVLPKSCAEEFFPSVDDAQCQPIEIQDFEGKDWNFKLRMWPNNNSKMYVLEGFEPYVRSRKLVEGDTVTFSRLVPEGKLVIGNRKGSTASSEGINTAATSENGSKGKRPLTTRKANVVTRVQSGLVIAEGDVALKRKSCEIGLTGKRTGKQKKRLDVVERGQELEDSPRGSNVPSDVVEKGSKRRRKKDIFRATTSKPARKCRTKLTTGNPNDEPSTIEPTVGNLEPGPSELAETEVTEREHMVTFVVPPTWVKKHPRHRTACICVVCRPPASRSPHNLSSQPLSHETGTSNTMEVEPGSSNRDDHMNDSSNAEGGQNQNSVSGSQSKGLLIDLNASPELDEELLDTTNDNQEHTSAGEM